MTQNTVGIREIDAMNTTPNQVAGGGQWEVTGRMVLLCLVAFFGVVFGVNFIMVRAATSTFGGVETASSYQAGLTFEREIEAARAQEARHWQVDAKLKHVGDMTRLDLNVRDAAGKPIAALEPKVSLVHPTDKRFDHPLTMTEDGSGHFQGAVTAAAGQWDLVIELSRDGGRLFRSKNRVGLR